MKSQLSFNTNLSKEQQDIVLNNVAEAVGELFATVAKRIQSERIKKGLEMKKKMKDEGEKYGEYKRI